MVKKQTTSNEPPFSWTKNLVKQKTLRQNRAKKTWKKLKTKTEAKVHQERGFKGLCRQPSLLKRCLESPRWQSSPCSWSGRHHLRIPADGAISSRWLRFPGKMGEVVWRVWDFAKKSVLRKMLDVILEGLMMIFRCVGCFHATTMIPNGPASWESKLPVDF